MPPLIVDLATAAAAAVTTTVQQVRQACASHALPTPVAPTLTIADPKIVLVKKPYQAPGHRLRLQAGVDRHFTGTGSLTCSEGAAVLLFDAHGAAVGLPLALTAAQLNAGVVLHVEGAAPSAAVGSTTFTLTLTAGGEPLRQNPATDSLTSVELQLDLCQYKPAPGGADPAPLGDAAKRNPGRNLHLQDNRHVAGRALLIVHKARPHAYAGDVVLTGLDGRVSVFGCADEVAANAQVPLVLPLATPNANIPATGLKLWVEGRRASAALRDSGFKLGISDLPRREGDRVNVTVVKAVLDVYQSPKAAGRAPAVIADGDKLNPGRFVHLQDAGNHHARAKLRVRHVLPNDFNGTLELLGCDAVGGGASARVTLFTAEPPGTGAARGANPYLINHNGAAFAADGEESWIEGSAVSGALRDTELRLRVADAEGVADRTALTVANLTQIQATIQPTPANNQANSNAMTPAVAAPVDHVFTTTSYDDTFLDNDLLVMARIDTAPAVRLVATAAPAALPLLWDAVRNPADHASLGGKSAIPTVTALAPVTQADLLTDAKGSFHVRVFIDCNGSGRYSPGEPSIPLSLVLADAKVVRDSSRARTSNLQFDTVGNRIVNGQWANAPLSPAGLATAGMAMELTADVTAGGADGRLGITKVFAGLINNVTTRGVNFSYIDNTVVPATNHSVRLIASSNPAAATGGGGNFYQPGDAAPALYALPLLDAGGGAVQGVGADTACMSRSVGSPEVRSARSVGQRWIIRCIDSPGTPFFRNHLANANAVLSRIDYTYAFQAAFCLWTNAGAVRSSTGDIAERRYAMLRAYHWDIRGVWSIQWPLGGAVVPTAVTKHKIRSSGASTFRPMVPPASRAIEVRPPSGIAAGLKWDAQ